MSPVSFTLWFGVGLAESLQIQSCCCWKLAEGEGGGLWNQSFMSTRVLSIKLHSFCVLQQYVHIAWLQIHTCDLLTRLTHLHQRRFTCDNPAKLRLRACHVSSVQLQHSGWEDGDLTPVTIFTCCRQTAWHCRVVRAVYPDTPPPSSLFGVCFSLSARLPDFVDNLELKKETVDTIGVCWHNHQSLPEFCYQIIPV